MKNGRFFKEYDVSGDDDKFSAVSAVADFSAAKTFSRTYDNGQGISLSLQYETKTSFSEYELRNSAQPHFSEYEVVSSRTKSKPFNRTASVQEYPVDFSSDNNFYVEPFEESPVSANNKPVKPITQQPEECACPPAADVEKPSTPKAGAMPLSKSADAKAWIPKSGSGNNEANKILNAISQMESSSTNGDEIDAGFLEDMKTILTDPKTARQQVNQVPEPTPKATKEDDIFDKIAKNMQYANQYDFGTMELEQRFNDFDQIEDSVAKVPLKPRWASDKAVQTVSILTPDDVNSSHFLEDIDLMNVSRPKSNPSPLDPVAGGRSILPGILEIGDIILSTTTDEVSLAIRSATGSEVSHASIYIGGGKVIHATQAGVQEWSVGQLMDACSLCVAYHHRDMDSVKAGKIVEFLKRALSNHSAFDGWGLIHAAPSQLLASYCDVLIGNARQDCLNLARRIQPGTDNNDQFFCSELIFAALKEAGLSISTVQPSFSSPQDAIRLYFDGSLQYVGHLKV